MFTSMLANAVDDPVLRQALLTMYFVPTGPSQIGDFVAGFDPVYARWVHRVYDVASRLAPTLDNENGAIIVPAIETPQTDEWDASLWFSDRSPSHVLQLALQTYLYFGRSFVEMNVWQCVLRLAEGKMATVPFIISVRIAIEVKRALEVDLIDAGRVNGKKTYNKEAVMFWNANAELKVRPNDGSFLLQSDKDAIMLIAAKIADSKGGQFTVEIDGQPYTGVEGASITFLPNELENGEQWKLRVATFVPPR
jgi:hypothetical protein